MASTPIGTEPVSGFPEWTPAEQIVFDKMLSTIRSTYQRYGFTPIETAAVERNDVLLAKGGEVSRQIYRLGRLVPPTAEDEPGVDLWTDASLHFDLTVPLARYVARHYGKLTFPFRRSQTQKVWRGERPQAGRFREFYQCDIDVIGDGELSVIADAEIPAVIDDVFRQLEIGEFRIHINNLKIVRGFLGSVGLEGKAAAIQTEIDKLEKNGVDSVAQALRSRGLEDDRVEQILAFVGFRGTNDEVLTHLRAQGAHGELFERGVDELATVLKFTQDFGVPITADLSIMRGLDYYTGTVYETELVNHPGLGSICSGGRFDDLASSFIDRKLPGVGISIGLTRLFWQLIRGGIVTAGPATVTQVLVTSPGGEASMGRYLKIATALRAAGINTEVFLEKASMRAQLRHAQKKGVRVVVFPFPELLENGQVKFKEMDGGDEPVVPEADLAQAIKNLL